VGQDRQLGVPLAEEACALGEDAVLLAQIGVVRDQLGEPLVQCALSLIDGSRVDGQDSVPLSACADHIPDMGDQRRSRGRRMEGDLAASMAEGLPS
jgi:hypothetical protein